MSYISLTSSARAVSFAAVLVGSGAAGAQTPSDIARSLWTRGQPAFATVSAPATASPASGFTALDLARLTAPHGAIFGTSAAPSGLALVPIAGGAADLARLSGTNPRSVQLPSRAITIATTAR